MLFDEESPEQSYLNELNEQDCIAMVLVEDLLPVWVVVFGSDLFGDDQILRLLQLTTESLKVYWGNDARVSLDKGAGVILFSHPDGRRVERFIAF